MIALLFIATTARAATVAEAVHAAAQTAPFDTALWFVLIEEEDGTIVHDRNAHKLAIPASVRKIFSAAAIAECLGPATRLQTELWLDGEDVVIKGGGDPSFGSDRYYEPEAAAFEPFLRALQQRRVATVRDIIVDVSMFDRATLPYNWKLGNITAGVAAPVDAITWSENAIESHAVASAGHFAGLAFHEVLAENGIAVSGRVRVADEPRSWQERVAVVESPFVYEMLAAVLKPSQNLFAETLYKRMSAWGEEPASYDASFDREKTFLTGTAGLDPATFRFVDASGLAPDDLVTPAAIVRMLRWMNEPSRREIWWNLLAEPGSEEGTLRRRLVLLAPRVRAKTGTVAGVASLAGVIAGRNGAFRYFAVIVNHHLGSSFAAGNLIDSIVEAAADF